MQPIKGMFNELQYELVKILLLNVFLSTVILFLIADLIALIFNMPLWYVIAVAATYFIITLVSEIRRISLRHVEQTNPELREMLRTAKDNTAEDSLMAHALFYEVLDKIKRVSSGSFLDFKKLITKIATIFVLAIILVSIAFFNINITRFDNPLEKPLAFITKLVGQITGIQPDTSGVQEASEDIFGDPSMAKLADNQLVATVNPSLDTPDFNNVDPSNPSNGPLADLSGEQGSGFNTPGSTYESGLSERDQERSYNYAKQTQTS